MRLARSIAVVLVLLVLGCGKKKSQTSAADAGPDQLLEKAGDDLSALCSLIKKAPDSPAGQKALEKAKAVHGKAAPAIKRRLGELAMQADVRDAFVAIVEHGAVDPCDRFVQVYAEPGILRIKKEEFDWIDDALTGATGWLDFDAMRRSIASGISEIGDGWMVGTYSGEPAPDSAGFPTIVVKVYVRPDGEYVGDDGAKFEKFMLSPSVIFSAPEKPGRPAIQAFPKAKDRHLPENTVVEFTRTTREGIQSTDFGERYVGKLLRILGEQVVGLPGEIGLQPSDPDLKPWAGFYAVKGGATEEDGCKGQIRFVDGHLKIDAMRRALVDEESNPHRVYTLTVADGVLTGKADLVSDCQGATDHETYVFKRKDENTLVGTCASETHLPNACGAGACPHRVAVEMTRAEPPALPALPAK